MAKDNKNTVTTEVQVKSGFWQTTTGILLKRVFFNAVAQVALVLQSELTVGHVNWGNVRYTAAAQLVYIVLTVARDLGDPKMANTTNDTKQVEIVK